MARRWSRAGGSLRGREPLRRRPTGMAWVVVGGWWFVPVVEGGWLGAKRGRELGRPTERDAWWRAVGSPGLLFSSSKGERKIKSPVGDRGTVCPSSDERSPSVATGRLSRPGRPERKPSHGRRSSGREPSPAESCGPEKRRAPGIRPEGSSKGLREPRRVASATRGRKPLKRSPGLRARAPAWS